MYRESVVSSSLLSVGYDEDEAVLEAEFAGGAIYRYLGVSEEIYTRLMAAPSIGRFFNAHIRDAFPDEKVR